MSENPSPFLRRHRWGVGFGVVAVVAAVWLAFGYFGVHTLFIDDEANDALPVFDSGAAMPVDESVPDADPAPADPSAEASEVVSLAEGDFIARSHSTSGRAVVLGDGTDQRFLRFEDFETDNGPDVNVYLSPVPADGDEGAFDDDFVDLGDLRGNIGPQNYEIPADVDLSRYRTVVLWCVRFSVAFGAADLA